MGFRELIWGQSWVYRLSQFVVWRKQSLNWFVSDIIKPAEGIRILDVGCGPADIVAYLDSVTYTGLDHNQKYIKKAKARWGLRANFLCLDVTDERVKTLGKFDIVLISAVLHHLTDHEINFMLRHAAMTLKPDGRLVTIDPTIEVGQHPIARWLAHLDRGRHVRTTDRYIELIQRHFTPLEIIVRHDLLRIPYTQCIMTFKQRE